MNGRENKGGLRVTISFHFRHTLPAQNAEKLFVLNFLKDFVWSFNLCVGDTLWLESL